MDALPFSDERLSAAVADRYDIERVIGRGGMATVYLARDRRHNRKVALKVLSPELGAVIGVERFLTEIQVTANLHHPNVLPLYDSGSGNGLLFYAMPFVEGETLRQRLERERQLPVDDALRIATDVLGALDYAHRHGVVHRDLKPENILLQDGHPMVADFGIALAVTNAGGNRLTQTGLSLGTPQYMSPEQATGEKVIDGRTDIYSLGCVLYEMLAGDPPHLGSSTQAIIAKLLTEKPASVRTTRSTVPLHVDYAIDKALSKVPADRWTTPHDFASALAGRDALPVASRPTAGRSRWRSALPWTVAAIAVGALLLKRPPIADVPATWYATLPGASLPDGFALSRDGSALAYIGVTGNAKQLHVRPVNQLDGHALSGTEGAQYPIWSPDGRRVAFTANEKILRIGRDGGAIEIVSPSLAYGYDWLDDEAMILGSSVAGTGLRVAAHAGAPLRELTKPNMLLGDMFHTYPVSIGHGRIAFISWGPGGLEDDFLSIADATTGKYVRSTVPALFPIALVDGWLLYLSADRRLMAARCDLGSMQLRGEPVTLIEDVVSASLSSGAALFLAAGRTTALERLSLPPHPERRTLIEYAGTVASPRLAPDGQHIAYSVIRRDGADLELYDLRSGTSTVLRSAPYINDAAWLPNGKELVYYETGADSGLWRISVERPTERTRLTVGDFPRQPVAAPDGKSVVYMANITVAPSKRGYSLFGLSLVGPPAPHPLVAYRYEESHPAISPDGRWMANGSLESGRNEIFVSGFGPNATGTRVRVSTEGGFEPRWSRDGRRLFYRSGLWARDAAGLPRTVAVATLRETGGTMEVVARDSVASFTEASASGYDLTYDVGIKNELFVAAANDKASQLVFAQDWVAGIRKRLAASRK